MSRPEKVSGLRSVGSIAFKLWAGMMILVLIMLALLWLFQIVFLESFYTGLRIAEVKKNGYALAGDLAAGVYSEGDQVNKLDVDLDAFAAVNSSGIEIIDSSGNILISKAVSNAGGQMPMMMMNSSRADIASEALGGTEAIRTVTHPRFGNTITLIALPVKMTNGRTSGALLITMPMAPVKDTVSILKTQLVYISVILFFVALVLAFALARSFTRPILEIKSVSAQMAAGDLSVRIMKRRSDEIGQLAESINFLGQELSKVEQLRKDLIANVSHELRTPLSLIKGYAEAIREVSGDIPQKREKHVGIILEEAERLNRIVDDILSLSQLQAGYVYLNRTQFDACALLERVVHRFKIISEKTGVTIELQCAGPAAILADEGRIEQVAYNLINNAFNHTPAGGNITVKARLSDTPGPLLRIEVADTGEGIRPEDLKYIWNRFYKADKSGSGSVAAAAVSTGTGLGLAIVKSILDAHGFTYGVSSEPDKGTTFWFEVAQ